MVSRVITSDKEEEQDFSQIPFDDIQRFGSYAALRNDMFYVSWLLGRFCNYQCTYCWPYARSSTKDHRPTELCLATIDSIKTQARDRGFNSFNWSLSGGEPTFHPGYLDIMKHLSDDQENCNIQRVHMTSNCSRKMKWFETYADYAEKFNRASLTASVHFEYLNTKEKIDEWLDKLVYVQERGTYVTVNMVMLPEKFWELNDHAEYFRSRGVHTTLKPQSDPTASRVVDGYTDEMKELLFNGSKTATNEIALWDSNGIKYELDQAERFNAFNFNNFEGWECSAGYRSIIIREPDGTIKRSYSCADKPLGHIETGFKLFPEVSQCVTSSCVSSADSKIPKRRVGNSGSLWSEKKDGNKI